MEGDFLDVHSAMGGEDREWAPLFNALDPKHARHAVHRWFRLTGFHAPPSSVRRTRTGCH
jgi:hypothetical protein